MRAKDSKQRPIRPPQELPSDGNKDKVLSYVTQVLEEELELRRHEFKAVWPRKEAWPLVGRRNESFAFGVREGDHLGRLAEQARRRETVKELPHWCVAEAAVEQVGSGLAGAGDVLRALRRIGFPVERSFPLSSMPRAGLDLLSHFLAEAVLKFLEGMIDGPDDDNRVYGLVALLVPPFECGEKDGEFACSSISEGCPVRGDRTSQWAASLHWDESPHLSYLHLLELVAAALREKGLDRQVDDMRSRLASVPCAEHGGAFCMAEEAFFTGAPARLGWDNPTYASNSLFTEAHPGLLRESAIVQRPLSTTIVHVAAEVLEPCMSLGIISELCRDADNADLVLEGKDAAGRTPLGLFLRRASEWDSDGGWTASHILQSFGLAGLAKNLWGRVNLCKELLEHDLHGVISILANEDFSSIVDHKMPLYYIGPRVQMAAFPGFVNEDSREMALDVLAENSAKDGVFATEVAAGQSRPDVDKVLHDLCKLRCKFTLKAVETGLLAAAINDNADAFLDLFKLLVTDKNVAREFDALADADEFYRKIYAAGNARCRNMVFQTACMGGFTGLIKAGMALGEKVVDVTRIDNQAINVVHRAAVGRDLQVLEMILDNVGDKERHVVNAYNKSGQTPLHLADPFDREMVLALLNKGADFFQQKDTSGAAFLNSSLQAEECVLYWLRNSKWADIQHLFTLPDDVFAIAQCRSDTILQTILTRILDRVNPLWLWNMFAKRPDFEHKSKSHLTKTFLLDVIKEIWSLRRGDGSLLEGSYRLVLNRLAEELGLSEQAIHEFCHWELKQDDSMKVSIRNDLVEMLPEKLDIPCILVASLKTFYLFFLFLNIFDLVSDILLAREYYDWDRYLSHFNDLNQNAAGYIEHASHLHPAFPFYYSLAVLVLPFAMQAFVVFKPSGAQFLAEMSGYCCWRLMKERRDTFVYRLKRASGVAFAFVLQPVAAQSWDFLCGLRFQLQVRNRGKQAFLPYGGYPEHNCLTEVSSKKRRSSQINVFQESSTPEEDASGNGEDKSVSSGILTREQEAQESQAKEEEIEQEGEFPTEDMNLVREAAGDATRMLGIQQEDDETKADSTERVEEVSAGEQESHQMISMSPRSTQENQTEEDSEGQEGAAEGPLVTDTAAAQATDSKSEEAAGDATKRMLRSRQGEEELDPGAIVRQGETRCWFAVTEDQLQVPDLELLKLNSAFVCHKSKFVTARIENSLMSKFQLYLLLQLLITQRDILADDPFYFKFYLTVFSLTTSVLSLASTETLLYFSTPSKVGNKNPKQIGAYFFSELLLTVSSSLSAAIFLKLIPPFWSQILFVLFAVNAVVGLWVVMETKDFFENLAGEGKTEPTVCEQIAVVLAAGLKNVAIAVWGMLEGYELVRFDEKKHADYIGMDTTAKEVGRSDKRITRWRPLTVLMFRNLVVGVLAVALGHNSNLNLYLAATIWSCEVLGRTLRLTFYRFLHPWKDLQKEWVKKVVIGLWTTLALALLALLFYSVEEMRLSLIILGAIALICGAFVGFIAVFRRK